MDRFFLGLTLVWLMITPVALILGHGAALVWAIVGYSVALALLVQILRESH